MTARVPEIAVPVLFGLGVGAVALVGVALIGRYALRKASAAVGSVAPYVNPASDKNLVYDGVIGATGRAVSGDASWSLGGWLWELSHPAEVKKENELLKPSTGGGSGW